MASEIDLKHPALNRLIVMIESGEIVIPPLQRPFSWSPKQIKQLLDSIMNDYPVGSALLWETNERLQGLRSVAGFKLPRKNTDYPILYVLDGQQRLSALYGVFAKARTKDQDIEGYEVDHNDFEIYYCFEEDTFVNEAERKSGNTYLPLNVLMDPSAYTSVTSGLGAKYRKKAGELMNIFYNYEVPLIITKKRTWDEVGTIFTRINDTGTKLDLVDLMVAKTWTPDFHLKEEFLKIDKLLARRNFSNVDPKAYLQCISAFVKESTRTTVIKELEPQKIRDSIAILEAALAKAIDFLSDQLLVKTKELLPHMPQLVPLCYFFSLTNSTNSTQNKALKTWFWKTSFSLRYRSGTDVKMDEDIAALKELAISKSSKLIDKYEHTITKEQLINITFKSSNPFARSLILLLAHQHPSDLVNGAIVNLEPALSRFNKNEYHHIFPKAFLKKQEFDTQKINSISNFTLLPASSNKIISNKAPSDYFFNVIPQDSFKKVLNSNLLPLDPKIYRDDKNYDHFLEERAGVLIRAITEALS